MKQLFYIALLCLAYPVASLASEPLVSEYTFDNGLKLLVQEDHRAPVVVSQVWYKVGSSYEYGGITGISHMLEHMMFKGTAKHPPGEFSRIIAANGGSENAFTGRDYTAYFQSLEKSRLAISFELEADRMRNLRLKPDEFAKEQQVVIEERRLRTDDQPRARMEEHFMAMAHTNGPYKDPVIGWSDDIAGLGVTDLQQWYQNWYAPNNATVVVVGDVEPQAVHVLAKKYFAPLKPAKLSPLKSRSEVAQLGERRLTIKIPAQLPHLVMGYKVPSLKTAIDENDAYALEVAAAVLAGGDSARLSSRLVRGQQIAVGADAGYDLAARLPSLFSLEATPAQGKTIAELEQALREQVRLLRDEQVNSDELQRIKAQVVAGKVYEQDSGFYQAMQLGVFETVGLGWRKSRDYVDRIQAITPEQIQTVAKKYLIDDYLTVATLDPLPMGDKKILDMPAAGGGHVR